LSAPSTLTLTTQKKITPAQPDAPEPPSDQTGATVGAIVGSIVALAAIGLAFAMKLRNKNRSLLTTVPQDQT
jgi:hypothetical protein